MMPELEGAIGSSRAVWKGRLIWTLIIIGGILTSLWVISATIDLTIWGAYRHYIDTLSDRLSINRYLANVLNLVFIAPFFLGVKYYLFSVRDRQRRRRIGLALLLGMGVLYNLALYYGTRNEYFGPNGPVKFYALVPGGVVFSDRAGIESTYGIPFRPVNQNNIKWLLRIQQGKIALLADPAHHDWFDRVTGDPLLWYSTDGAGSYRFFDGPGHDPATDAELKPVTPSIQRDWEKKFGAAADSRVQGAASAELAANSMGTPQITAVSNVQPQQLQMITISGSGFGSRPPYTGDSDYIRVSDVTKSWNAGSMKDPGTDKVTLYVTTWTDTAIVIGGFAGSYGSERNSIDAGDQLEFQVWNAQSGSGPSVFSVVAAQGGFGAEDAHPETPTRQTYQRVSADDFLFEIQSCVLSGTELTCDFTVKNDLDSDRTLGLLIYWGSCSQIFDEEGNEYISKSGQLGSDSGTPGISGLGNTLISGVKINASLKFEGISPNMKLVKLLRIVFASPHGSMNHLSVDFRDVPVQGR